MASLYDVDWDEELKRQAAISALLATPEEPPKVYDTQTDEQVVAAEEPPRRYDTQTDEQVVADSPEPSIPKHVEEHYGSWKKWDTATDQQVIASDMVYPTIAQDQPAGLPERQEFPRISPPPPEPIAQPPPTPPPGLITDPESGARYIEDQEGGYKVPYAELATEADKQAFRPGDVTLPQSTVTGVAEAPDKLSQVERAQLVAFPDGTPATMPWHPAGQAPDALTQVERAKLVKLPPKPVPGFIEESTNAIANPAAGVIPPVRRAEPVTYPTVAQDQGAPGAPPAVQRAQPVGGPQQPTAEQLQVTRGEGFWGGDLSQGPSGTKPDGTENEPYWPKGDKDVALLPPGANYIDPKDQSQKVTPGTPAPAPADQVQPPAPVQQQQPVVQQPPVDQVKPPAPVQQPAAKPALDDFNTWLTPDGTPVGPAKPAKTAKPSTWEIPANPDGSDLPQRVQAVGDKDPQAFVVHHTSGRGTVDGVVSTLRERGLGVEYVMDRNGNIFQIGNAGASHIKNGWGPVGTGLNNGNTVGMEIIALDDKDVTQAQKDSFARFMAARYPNTQIYGHGEVNPGHKEADEGMSAKAAALAYREKGGAGDQDQGDTLAQLKSGGLNVTTFGQKDDPYGDPDSRRGAGKYVEQMIPGYDVALNAAAARAVGNPKPGEEFTFGGRTFRYGDKVPEIYSDARFDVFDPYNTALATLGKEKAAAEEPKKEAWESWATISPEDQKTAETQAQAKAQATQQAETASVYKLPEAQNSNIIGLYKRLATSVPDVSDQTRSQIQAKLKPEIIAQMRAKFPEIKTDDEAWAKAQSGVNALDIGQDWGSKAIGFVQQFTEPMKKGAADTDKFSVDQFLSKAMPNASDADRHEYLTRLYGLPLDQRVAEIEARLGPGFVQPGNPYRDPFFLAKALDRLSDPGFQKRQADDVAKFQEEMKRNISSDPRLADTKMERIVNDTAQIPAAVAAFSNPAMWPMALGQVHEQVLEGFKREHPEWDAKTLQEKSAYATLTQFFGGLVAGHVMSAGAGVLMEGIEGKAQRAIAQAVLGGTSQAAVGGLTQVGTNVVVGDPLSKGTGEASLSGLIQGTATGVGHGAGELAAPRAKPEALPPPLPAKPGEQVVPPVAERPPVSEPIPPPVQERPPVTEPIPPPGEEARPPQPAFPTEEHGQVYDGLVQRGMDPQRAQDLVSQAQGNTQAEILESVQAQMRGQAGPKPQPPVEERPPVVEPDPEEHLNKQNEELFNRYKTQGDLEKQIGRPIEEKPVSADISEGDRRTREAELGPTPGQPGRPGGEDVRGDAGQEPRRDGHPAPGRGQDVPVELGRLSGPLESKLSPEERAALQPLVDAVAAHPAGTPQAKAAFRDLLEGVYKKFEPLFRAAGSRRIDSSPDFEGVAAATYNQHGALEHLVNHERFERQVRKNLERGNDPAQYIHSVLHEELTHHAEQLAERDIWNRTKAKTGENFVGHKFRRSREVIDNFLAARDRARAKGNHVLAAEMDRALHESIQMYRMMGGPQEAEGHFQDIYGKAKAGDFKAQNELANTASELVRQMVQLRHGDSSEAYFRQAMGAAIDWFQRAISGLKSLYAKLGPGQALAKTELAKLVRATERKLETLVRMAGRAEKPGKRPAEGIGPRTAHPESLEEAVQRQRTEVQLRGGGAEVGKTEGRLRYEGAPPGVKDARSLGRLKDQLTQLAREGQAFKDWYTEGAGPMMRGVGNDPARFERLMANIAATSPQNRVYPNFGMAVRGLAQQEAGGRRITVGKGEQMKQRLAQLGRGEPWQGVKTNQFYRDHMAVFDKRLQDDLGSTMDMHMARALGYPTDGFTPKQSQWSQGVMREVTQHLGWDKPKETQAAIWSAIKARFETVWPGIYAEAKANGDIVTKVTRGGTEKTAFKDPATELKYRNRALKEAMKIPAPDLSEAAFNFGDALKRDLGSISYETRPSSEIQARNPWMQKMSPEDWDEYHQQQAAILLDPDGTNRLAKATGLISIGEHQGYSAWGTERNLSQQITAVMPKAAGITLERAGQKWKIDPTVEHQIKDFAAATGLLYRQDGVGWHRPYFDAGATQKESNGILINAGRPLTKEETSATVAALEKHLPSYQDGGAKGWFVAPEARGLRIVSWGHDDNNIVHKAVRSADKDIGDLYTAKLDHFVSYGNLLENNWKEHQNGDIYRRWLTARRRPDLQRLVDDSLRPQAEAIDRAWETRKSQEARRGELGAGTEGLTGAAREGEPGEARGPPEGREFFGPGAPVPKRKISLGERIAAAKLAHSLGFKSGESALLDYKETEPLSIALRREPSLRQAYGQRAKLLDLEQAFNSIPKAERARVTQEWTDYIKAEQTKQPLPAVGADTLRLLDARKDTANEIGGLLKQLNIHVMDSKGKVRPVKLIGSTYYPWRISDNTRDIFDNRDGHRAAEFNQIVQGEIAAGNVKTRQEFIDKFTHAINGEAHSNDHFSNVERAREMRLPYSFYDFSPEAFLHYAPKAVDRLAQVGAYGQKMSNKGKDIFDHTIDAVNASGTLSHDAKEAIINRVASERKAAFQRGGEGVLDRIGQTGRRAATGLMLSNPQTSLGNFISGAAQNMVFGGPSNFLKTAAQFPFKFRQMFKDAREMNILKTNLKDVLYDYDLVTNPSWLQKLTEFGLKAGGQNLTENINRVFGLQQAKNVLHDFVREYGVKNNSITRTRNEFILRRFGGKPDAAQAQARLSALANERGVGPLSDEFMRQYVNDVHGTYAQAQAPAHLFDSPAGKVLMQFQKWGFNTGRMANREYVAPMIRAFQSGSMADKGYHVLRNVAYLATGAASGTVLQMMLNGLYHRDPKDPSLAEIGKAVSEGDYGKATAQGVKRAWGALILSGFSGMAGNYVDVINNLTGTDPSGRLKDPMHPPAWGVIEPFIAFAKGWAGEGTAVPSETLTHDFLTRLASPMRVGYNLSMGLASSAGLKMPPVEHYAAQQERSFTRSRISMFEKQDPAMQQKAAQQGTRAVTIQMAGRRPFDPYRDRILNGLSSGHEVEVNDAIRDWLSKVPDEQKAAEVKRIKDTINANSPLKVGGSTKPENVLEFLNWAKANLPEPEARRIFALAQTYSKTALATGLEEKSKTMHQLSIIDYDKLKAAPTSSPQAQAGAKAKAAAQGRAIMANLAVAVKRKQAEEALRLGRR